MINYLLSALAVSTMGSAFTDWRFAASATNGAVWYVDIDSIKQVYEETGTVRKAWIRIDFSKVKTEPAREAKVLAFFRCAEEMVKITTWVSYKADGSVLENLSDQYAQYKPVVPETVLSGTMQVVCPQNLGDIP